MAYYPSMSAAVADGLLRYWDFDDLSFTVADRASGFDGAVYLDHLSPIPVDPIPFFPGYLFGYAFATATQIPEVATFPEEHLTPVELPREVGAPTLSTFSIRIRFRFDGFLGGQSVAIILNTEPDDIYQTVRLYVDSGNALKLIRPPLYSTHPLGTITVGEWHEVLLSFDDNDWFGFVDGVYIHSGGGGNSTEVSLDAPINVAAPNRDGLSMAFNGQVDELAIWSRRFYLADAQAMWNSGDGQALVARPITAELDAVVPLEFDFWIGDLFPEASIDADIPIIWDVRAYQDWTASLPPLQRQEIYTLTIRADGQEPITVPMSSWQATNQAQGRQKYVQAVVPAALGLAEALEARINGTLAISKGYRFDNGSSQLEEIVTAALETIRPDQGIRSYSLTLSGYADGDPVSTGSRTLTGVSQISMSNGKPRVRCDIDLFLRPGMTVTANGIVFRADYINYYVGPNQKFCEVAER